MGSAGIWGYMLVILTRGHVSPYARTPSPGYHLPRGAVGGGCPPAYCLVYAIRVPGYSGRSLCISTVLIKY